MKKLLISVIAVTVGSVLFTTSVPEALAQGKKGLSVTGAGLLSDVVETYGEMLLKEAPDCSITVSGATTGIGFQRLFEGVVDMAMSTRQITAEEIKIAEGKGVPLASKYIGKIGLAIVTNSKNTVEELTLEQLAAIFKGEITNWNKVGGPSEPIKVTIRAVPETGAGVLFQETVLKGAPYAKDCLVMGSYNTTVSVCGKSYGIGYIPTTTIYFDKLQERGVKVVKIKKDAKSSPYQLTSGVAKETLYPISVDFLIYWNSKNAHPCVQRFVDFAVKQTQ